MLAKTDRVDARMLAILGDTLDPAVTEPPSELLEGLQELVRGQAASDERTALLNRRGGSKTKCLIRELNRQLRALETSLSHLDAEIQRLIQSDPCLARRFEILVSIPGVGEVIAAAIVAELREIGTLSAKETGMLAGLAQSPATPAIRSAPATSEEAALICATPCTWARSTPPASIPPSSNSTIGSSPKANWPKSPSPPSCESYSSSPTPSSARTNSGS